jgi:RimJ/RimL family protein N-acetyltransferase
LAGAQPASQDIGVQPQAIADRPQRIRPLTSADIEPIYSACQDPLVQEWTLAIPVPYAHADAESFVTHICPLGWAEDRDYTWGIEEASTHEFLGVIGLRIQDDDCSEVGYWLAPGARGRGVMTQALSAVCEFATGRLGHDVVKWQAIVGNEASRRVAERVGFEVGPPVRGFLRRRGERVDGWTGTLLPTDTPRPRLPVLTDGVVSLRAPRGADLEILPDLVDDEVLKWTGVPGRSREDLQPWLDVIRRPDRPPAARFAITDAAGHLQGFLRLSSEPISESVTVGWWLGPAARGRGYASRAVRLALGWSAANGAHRFAAGIFDGNGASIALAERLGMQSEGLRRAYWPPRDPGDRRRDTWLYSLVPSDPGWPSS